MKIAALTVTKRPHLLPHVLRLLQAQTRRPDAWLVFLHSDEPGIAGALHVQEKARAAGLPVHVETRPTSLSLGLLRNEGVMQAIEDDFVAMVDDDDWYGPGYFLDLGKSIQAHPWGDIYGIREFQMGFVRDTLELDGSNIIGRRFRMLGSVIEGDRVSWVAGATIGIRIKSWREKGFRYRDLRRSVETALCEDARHLGGILIQRPSDNFCAVRYLHQDGYGGPHGHTWGPIFYAPPPPFGMDWRRGRARMAAGLFEEAIPIFEQLIGSEETGDFDGSMASEPRFFKTLVYECLATCHFKLGRYAESRRYFELAARYEPDTLEYRVKQALCARLERPPSGRP